MNWHLCLLVIRRFDHLIRVVILQVLFLIHISEACISPTYSSCSSSLIVYSNGCIVYAQVVDLSAALYHNDVVSEIRLD